ncbi:MAG TPA: phosphodiester glycosidase family protein, partial [Bacteroidia bacterium]|nr:phosphodiester glycosidase family protein [Bacteroidia bacterium]
HKHQTLLFATNGGMYKPDNSPQGLFIQSGKVLAKLDTASGSGNFYLKPNGVFYITSGKQAFICNTSSFKDSGQVLFATQSGPILVIDGKIHSGFTRGSKNLNIRNGVGILPDNRIVFAMSKEPISFYDFANYFKSLGCKNALYLDGFVSRTYLPEKKWEQTDGNFGVIIGVTN